MDSTDNSKLSHPRKPYYYGDTGKATAGGLERRRVTRVVTPPVSATTGKVQGVITLPSTSGATLLSLKAAQDTWLRLYANAADRNADFGRSINTFPPTTPCLFDGLVKATELTNALDRTLWSPADGCSNEGNAGFAFDANGATYWDAGGVFADGQNFAVDFGAIIALGSITMETAASALEMPATMRVDVSSNGTDWHTLIPEVDSVDGDSFLSIDFSETVNTRYMRFVYLTDFGHGGARWYITELNAYPFAGAGLSLRLSNGDEFGIPVSNWDDPAQPQLYYTAQCDQDILYALYHGSFGHRMCDLRGFSFAEDGTLIIGAPDSSYDNCYLTGDTPPLQGVEYVNPGALRPRYYVLGPDELRPFGVGGIVRVGPLPASMPEATGAMTVRRSRIIDTTVFGAGICYYVYSGGRLFNASAYLRIGVARESSTSVRLEIVWFDGSGTAHDIASHGGISLGLDAVGSFTTAIGTDDDDNTVGIITWGGVTTLTATLPTEFITAIQDGAHDAVGFYLDAAEPPSAPLAFGGLGATSIAIAGGTGQAVFDLGYAPLERSGGTLRHP